MQETILYSLKTVFVGMTVVFSFLAFLSLMMGVIKAVFQVRFRPSRKKAAFASASATTVLSTAQGTDSEGPPVPGAEPPPWLIPAAVVLLFIEEAEKNRSAAPWLPSAGENLHPWLLSGGQER
jgi:Na+-transporting methylmalonyl-CoA/oxaloacetate decarboxylase gamma subunit